MIDFKELGPDESEAWELFARDFLMERGFFVETPPDRGPDNQKDLLVTEELKGRLGRYKMRWLVSCKHFATSGKAVSPKSEPNITDRLKHFKADGFIGFYSTIPSSGLNQRLQALRANGEFKDYCMFDHKRIENALVTAGYSHLMWRYFPVSYEKTRPLHLVFSKYEPLPCAICGKDLLKGISSDVHSSHMLRGFPMKDKAGVTTFTDIACVCKKNCNRKFEARMRAKGVQTMFHDLADLTIPVEFLRFVLVVADSIRKGRDCYTDEAYEQQKGILLALAQKVLRMTTDRERERFLLLQS
jgi:hypothetical protein